MRQRWTKTEQAFCISVTAFFSGHSASVRSEGIAIEMPVLGGWLFPLLFFLFIFFFLPPFHLFVSYVTSHSLSS